MFTSTRWRLILAHCWRDHLWYGVSGTPCKVEAIEKFKNSICAKVPSSECRPTSSFASINSWKQIYGAPIAARSHFIKGELYEIYGAGIRTGCIDSERDPKVHAEKKKNLTPTFSTKALQAQDPIIQRHIDRFGLDVVKWYEMIAFDILGEMAFGESFHCVEREEHHFWIKLILDHLLEITLYAIVIQDTVEQKLKSIIPSDFRGNDMLTWSRRLSSTSSRQDFFTDLAEKVKSGQIDKEEMTAHASTLIIAGGETVAICLAAATYYLLTTPAAYARLKREIRGRYQSYEEIDASSALQLDYLQGMINEALRILPPSSQGFPRISPGLEIDGYYVPSGTEVYTSAWTVTHDPQYFKDPETFRPGHWRDPKCTDQKEASRPFSLGLRACIGRK
ncbi:uncharacterized protein N7483_000460 [Penicillium malachiteum]|uniref:uncharacterized protein n=1 Tax=Penicillium malachiteum TaxID=1324776 RepID=UPI002548D10C|nr:uncharacterized protein N7483_000460 [Penicillium malachiteum]KAJ5735335.1 hypothetical protein N7483_000460 [Penicillium malachiteum]